MQNIKPKIVVFDLDGTLFNGAHRAHLIPEDKSRTENFEEFNSLCHKDTIIEPVLAIFLALRDVMYASEGPYDDIIFLTSRCVTSETKTLDALFRYGIDGHPLLMREIDDHRSPVEYKSARLDELEEMYEVGLMFDDDKEICEMARERGIYAVQVTEFWKYGEEHVKC